MATVKETKMTAACLCGAVSITIDARPQFVNDCNCTLCRKSGAAWAYFSSSAVRRTGRTVVVTRQDKALPAVEVHSCEGCAATTHFELTPSFRMRNPSADLTGVNMRLFDPAELLGIEVRFPNGKEWSGEGPYSYRRAALMIGTDGEW
jgi:hypothetical protein